MGMLKYNIGDRVRIKKYDDMMREYASLISHGGTIYFSDGIQFSSAMQGLCGREFYITEKIANFYKLGFEPNGDSAFAWRICDEMIVDPVLPVKTITTPLTNAQYYKDQLWHIMEYDGIDIAVTHDGRIMSCNGNMCTDCIFDDDDDNNCYEQLNLWMTEFYRGEKQNEKVCED